MPVHPLEPRMSIADRPTRPQGPIHRLPPLRPGHDTNPAEVLGTPLETEEAGV